MCAISHEVYETNNQGNEIAGDGFISLEHLIAEVEQHCAATGPTKDDRQAAEGLAGTALRLALTNLRAVTENPDVDVHLNTLKFLDYRDDADEKIGRFGFRIRFPMGSVLEKEAWSTVAEAVASKRDVQLARQWLLDAIRLLDGQNHNMALAAAAISCEVSLHSIVIDALTASGRVSENQASGFTEEVSNRKLPVLLRYLGVLTEIQIDTVIDLFGRRNEILHGKQRKLTERSVVRKAVDSARTLLAICENPGRQQSPADGAVQAPAVSARQTSTTSDS